MAFSAVILLAAAFIAWHDVFAIAAVIASNSNALSSVVTGSDINDTVSLSCETPSIPHSSLRDESVGNYTVGGVAEIVCDAGFRFPHIKSTVLQVVCHADGSWTDILGIEGIPSCELIGGCPTPRVANGYVVPQKIGGFMPGDTAIFHCVSHYVMMPRNVRPILSCNKDGTWSSDGATLPTCEAASSFRCPLPSSVKNGNFKIVDDVDSWNDRGTVRSGVQVFYYCNEGYRVSPNMSAIIECRDGSWTSPSPVCQPRQAIEHCGSAPEIPHTRYYIINGSSDRNGSFHTGVKIVYLCDHGFRPECPSCSFTSTCRAGEWIGHGPKCIPELSCASPPSVQHAGYTISPRDVNNGMANTWGSQVADGARAFYYCNSGYRMLDNNASTLTCRNGVWLGLLPSCVNRTGCDSPMDIENGNWIIQSLFADFRFGVRVTYECDPGYKAIGMTDITCLASGYWSEYPPKCLTKDEYCSEPLIRDGFFMCKPRQCDSYRVGTELHYYCNSNYKMSPTVAPYVQTCQPGGQWSRDPPVCLPDFVDGNTFTTHASNLGANTITVVISSSCAVLGLLVLVILAVALQRRLKPNGAAGRLCPSSLPGGGGGTQSLPGASAPYPLPIRDGDEHDRLALIAFADDVRGAGLNAPLPTYEEAIRCATPHVYHGFSHFVDGASRTSSGRSSRSGEYRPLPSIRLMRDGTQQPMPTSSGDPRRNSIVTNASNNLSVAAFGSMDTVNAAASDATSTSVTVDTYDSMASNPSIVASQRATAGSIESASMHGSLSNEAVPLLDQQRDGAGCDTLRSQSSRGTHSDTASRIVEVAEDNKID